MIHAFPKTWNRFIYTGILLWALLVSATFAIPPTSPYLASETLDPTCAPGDVNCIVSIFPDQVGNAGKFLTTNGTGVSWATISPGVSGGGLSNRLSLWDDSTTISYSDTFQYNSGSISIGQSPASDFQEGLQVGKSTMLFSEEVGDVYANTGLSVNAYWSTADSQWKRMVDSNIAALFEINPGGNPTTRFGFFTAGDFDNTKDSNVNFIANVTFGQGQTLLWNAENTAYTNIKISPSLSSGWTLTLPATTGSNGQVLTTDGSGTTSWTTVGSIGGSIGVTQLAFGSGTNSITGTSNLVWNNTSQQLNIGGAAGVATLDVLNGATNQTASSRVLNISNTGATFDTTLGILTSYGGYFSSTSTRATGAFALRNVGLYATASGAQNNYAAIFDQGNVGIGTTTPTARLEVNAGNSNPGLAVTGRTTLDSIGIGGANPNILLVSSGFANDTLAASVLNTNSNSVPALIVGLPNNVDGMMFRNLANTTDQVLMSAGITGFRWVFQQNNIIGTDFIDYGAVEINATLKPTSGNGQVAALLMQPTINQTGGSSGNMRGIYYNPTVTSVLTNHIAFENTTGDVRLNSTSGVTSIGTTNNTYKLNVGNNSISGIVARFENSSGTCDINPTTSSLSCSSDERLKKDITSIDSTILEKVLTLRPVTYHWNTEAEGSSTHVGFIAQEVEQIFPDLVTVDPITQLRSLNYMGLIPYTIKALQEIDIKTSTLPVVTDQTFIERLKMFLQGIAEQGVALIDTVRANKLCAEDVCVDKVQLKQMIDYINAHSDTPLSPSGDTGIIPVTDVPPVQEVGGQPPLQEEEMVAPTEHSEPIPEPVTQTENSAILQ